MTGSRQLLVTSIKLVAEDVDRTTMTCRTCGEPLRLEDSHVMGKGAHTEAFYVHGECVYGDPLYTQPSPNRPKRLIPKL